jgi:hypothetical protein
MFASLVAAQVLTLYAVPGPTLPDLDRQFDYPTSNDSELGRNGSDRRTTPTTTSVTHLGNRPPQPNINQEQQEEPMEPTQLKQQQRLEGVEVGPRYPVETGTLADRYQQEPAPQLSTHDNSETPPGDEQQERPNEADTCDIHERTHDNNLTPQVIDHIKEIDETLVIDPKMTHQVTATPVVLTPTPHMDTVLTGKGQQQHRRQDQQRHRRRDRRQQRGTSSPTQPTAAEMYVSPWRLEPKMEEGQPTGKYRFICDMRWVNDHVADRPFKYPHLSQVPVMAAPGDRATSFDLKDFFYSFPVATPSRKYFQVRAPLHWPTGTNPQHPPFIRGAIYHFTGLPMGYKLSPFAAHKAMRWVTTWTHHRKGWLLQYVDDFLIGSTSRRIRGLNQNVRQLIADLGFRIHPTKGWTTPKWRFVFLGLGVDRRRRVFFVPVY